MNAVFDDTASGLSQSQECYQAGERGNYHFTSVPDTGSWACYYSTSDVGQLIWTNTGLDILSVASDPDQTPEQLNGWFLSPADTGPD